MYKKQNKTKLINTLKKQKTMYNIKNKQCIKQNRTMYKKQRKLN